MNLTSELNPVSSTDVLNTKISNCLIEAEIAKNSGDFETAFLLMDAVEELKQQLAYLGEKLNEDNI